MHSLITLNMFPYCASHKGTQGQHHATVTERAKARRGNSIEREIERKREEREREREKERHTHRQDKDRHRHR